MNIFEVGELMEGIQQAVEEGRDPDPAALALLLEEGPGAIEKWADAIDNTKAERDAIKKRLDELKARHAAREQAIERMDGALRDLLARHFHGKVKTPLLTAWVQRTPVYQVQGADPVAHPQFFKFPEPELKKSEVIKVHKEGVLPEGVTVTEDFTESVRMRR